MQRLLSLGLLAVVVGGGWSMLNGFTVQDVQRVAEQVRGAANQMANANGGYTTPQPSYPQQQYSSQPQYSMQPQGAFAPAPRPTTNPTIRIASFNIQVFGNKKASKPYVMHTLAEIVRRFDIVAVQEIRTQDDFFINNFLRDYVNAGGRARYAASVSPRLGRTNSTEQYAYLFNTATIDISPQVDFVLEDREDALHREPHVALFRTRVMPAEQAFTFILMNSHTDPDEIPEELNSLYGAYQAVQRMSVHGAVEDDVILLGDLNTNVPANSPRTQSRHSRNLIPSDLGLLARVQGIYPLIRDTATNTRGSRIHDNLLIPRITTTEFTGRSGVFDMQSQFGLKDKQALEVSDHLPVWGEFSAYESRQLGPVASGIGTEVR